MYEVQKTHKKNLSSRVLGNCTGTAVENLRILVGTHVFWYIFKVDQKKYKTGNMC